MRVEWDKAGEKRYETGTKYAVLYPISLGAYTTGVAWNGITAVTESPSGAEQTSLYADDIKYANLESAEEFGGTIEAYTYPDEFMACDGSKEIANGVVIGQQERQKFGLCYRTTVGNDTDGNAHGYKLHLVYGCSASPSEKSYATINDSPDAITFSWEFKTTPVNVTGHKPTATLIVDSTKTTSEKMAALEAILYGTDDTVTYTEFTGESFEVGVTYYERSGAGTEQSPYVYTATSDASKQDGKTYYTKSVTVNNARLPLPDEVMTLMSTNATPGQG